MAALAYTLLLASPTLRTLAGGVAALEALLKHTVLKLSLCGGLGLLGLLSGCGESTSFEGTTPIPITELPSKYSAAICAAYSACVGPFVPVVSNGTDCTTTWRRVLEDELPNYQAAVTSGKVKYDGTKLQACVDKVAGLGCSAINQRDIDLCVATLSGTVSAGMPCTMDVECAQGTFCNGPACPGICTARQAAGATCKNDTDCASGLGCHRDKCETPGSAGDVCGGQNDANCREGLMCVGADAQAGKAGQCRALADVFAGNLGDSCDPRADKLCKSGSVCTVQSYNLLSDTLVAKCAAPVTSGAACKIAGPDACPPEEFCKVTGSIVANMVDGSCTRKPTDGEPCAADFSSKKVICAPYTVCNKSTTCVNLERTGGACESASICYSGTCTGGKCVAGGKCN